MTSIEEIKDWVKNPAITSKEEALTRTEESIEQVQAMIREGGDTTRLGPLMGQLKGFLKLLEKLEVVEWVKVNGGHMAVGHRPSKQMMQDLKVQGATHLLTLLSEKEGAKQMRDLSKASNIDWLHFPMESAKAPDQSRFDELKSVFITMRNVLEGNGKIYIHCSAGIHRTGMITNAFLRYIGLSAEEALAVITSMRTETSEGVGEERLAFAEEFKKA